VYSCTDGMYYSYDSALEIAFLVDGTFSSYEWGVIRRFMSAFSDQFYVSSTFTRFAVIQFSRSTSTTFSFSQYSTNAQLRTAYVNLRQQQVGRERNLNAALRYSYDNVFRSQRRNYASMVRTAHNIIIIIIIIIILLIKLRTSQILYAHS